jgi:carbamoyltransferase
LKAIVGISAFYHDSAAAIVVDGEIIAAAQEERFSRKKYDASFPRQALAYVFEESGISPESVSAVAFYEKPFLKFERLLETAHAFAPRGLGSFLSAMPIWLKKKLFLKKQILQELTAMGLRAPTILFPEHHLSHAASAFYPSPYEEAAIVTIDGVGEWATTAIGKGTGNSIAILKELAFPHSIGLLYSAVTYFCGFRVNSGEYKLMGLAPFGDMASREKESFKKTILEKLVDIRDDGSILLNMENFEFATGLRMVNDKKWEKLFGIPCRKPEGELNHSYMNLALAIQEVTEEVVFRLAATAKMLTNCDVLTMAGGVALNCVANGKLARKRIFKDIWVQPAAGDAGGALGAALCGWYLWLGNKRFKPAGRDAMRGTYLGPEFSSRDVERLIVKYNAKASCFSEFSALCEKTASLIADGKVIGWFQGRMEYGPRSLGNRSILADPRDREMQKKLNGKIKFREGFRPFAPSVLIEDARTYFELAGESPYMLVVAYVNEAFRKPVPSDYASWDLYARLYYVRSRIPAVTHVDYSARIQTVHRETNEKYWTLINAFKKLTGIGLVVNTSFNVRGEPVVCRPDEAYRCFMSTQMDYLVINNFLFVKTDQPETVMLKAATGMD